MSDPTSFPLASALGLLTLFEQALARERSQLDAAELADVAGRLARLSRDCRVEVETLSMRQEAAYLAQIAETPR